MGALKELPAFLQFTRKPKRAPMDERTPNGSTVEDLAANVIAERGTRADAMGGESAPSQPWHAAINAPTDTAPATRARTVKPVDPVVSGEVARRADLPVETDRTLPAGDPTLEPLEAMPPHIETSATPATRERIAAPSEQPWQKTMREYRAQLAALEADENPKDRNGKVTSVLQGLGRGFLRGGVMGAAAEGIRSGFAPNADERIARDEKKGKVIARMGRANTLRKADDEHEQSSAQTEWLRKRPDIEAGKVDLKRRYDEWRMSSTNRRQDSLEAYREFMMTLGDRRASTAEGRLDLEREWKTIIQPGQFERTFGQREDHFTRRQNQQQRQFDQTFGLRVDDYIEKQRHNLVGESQKTFDVAVKGRVERLKSIHTEIERWQKRKADNSTRPGEADEYISDLQAEALGLAGQIEAAREMVLSGTPAASTGHPAPSLAPPVRRNVPGASTSRPAAPLANEADIRARAIERGLDPDVAVQRARARKMLK